VDDVFSRLAHLVFGWGCVRKMPTSSTKAKTKVKGRANLPRVGEDNPFERVDNSTPKYAVLNRRVKGQTRNMGKAKMRVSHAQLTPSHLKRECTQSVETRRNHLLSDYKSFKKANSFDDRFVTACLTGRL
jgi:hypothetical protein